MSQQTILNETTRAISIGNMQTIELPIAVISAATAGAFAIFGAFIAWRLQRMAQLDDADSSRRESVRSAVGTFAVQVSRSVYSYTHIRDLVGDPEEFDEWARYRSRVLKMHEENPRLAHEASIALRLCHDSRVATFAEEIMEDYDQFQYKYVDIDLPDVHIDRHGLREDADRIGSKLDELIRMVSPAETSIDSSFRSRSTASTDLG